MYPNPTYKSCNYFDKITEKNNSINSFLSSGHNFQVARFCSLPGIPLSQKGILIRKYVRKLQSITKYVKRIFFVEQL